MTTLLVANRGEIALRIFRTAKRLGMRTVAVYSDADAQALHVRAADTAVHIGPAPAADSYLRRDRIVAAALDAGADLVHPGYGFLAEDDRFAADCARAGLAFVGPPAEVLRAVGDKASARALAQRAGVPVFPGYAGEDQSDGSLRREALRIGFPVLVKPAGGGGGKGMTVVEDAGALDDALSAARRIATSAFDDDRLILERYVAGPRHVEVQVFGDASGNVIHLGERDCSLQRRHQKILEESPAPNLDDDVRASLHDAAVRFASHATYVGAGTCEFLVSRTGDIGFIEMNARLQVEHPVTEMVTGLDLVEMQLRVAQGEKLPVSQDEITARGHAIEVRVYAEDPEGFLPQSGRVLHVRWPSTPQGSGGANSPRVDAGVDEGAEVSTHYDPLLAKVIVHGPDRTAAIDALQRALAGTELLGPRTNLTFLTEITAHPVVVAGTITTDWLEREIGTWRWPSRPDDEMLARAIAAAAELDEAVSTRSTDPWTSLGAWRLGGGSGSPIVVRSGGAEHVVVVSGSGPYGVVLDEPVEITRGGDHHAWRLAPGSQRAAAAKDGDRWHVWIGGAAYELAVGAAPRSIAHAGRGRLESPLPGQVVAVRVTAGQEVDAGEELVVVEAMKMEHAIKAHAAGTVRAVLCAPGDQVDRGQPLVDFEPAGDVSR
jgi:3-methylcrotonyl-CoA carboxylase alpha subunit